jgi:hypothetical protein
MLYHASVLENEFSSVHLLRLNRRAFTFITLGILGFGIPNNIL